MDEIDYSTYADMVSETYNFADGEEPTNIGNFQPLINEFTEKTGAWINPDKKEIIVTHRGIMLSKPQDIKTLITEIAPSYIPGSSELEYEEIYGKTGNMFADLNSYKDQVESLEAEYPEYEIILSGHSRGGGIALELGRDGNYTSHVFSPISRHNEEAQLLNRGKEATHLPSKINIYYTDRDGAPTYLRELENKFGEAHNIIEPRDDILKQEGSLMALIGMSGHSILHFATPIDFENLSLEDQESLELFNQSSPGADFYLDSVEQIPEESRKLLFDNREEIRDYIQPIPTIVKLTFSELVDLFPRYNRIKLRELFDKFDYDNSNYLDEQEFEMFILEM